MHNSFALLSYGLALLGAGLACGMINTLASSGSAISLPVLKKTHVDVACR
jgi:hypothetical protein